MPVHGKLQIKPDLPDEVTTPGRDEAAEAILELQDEGRLEGMSAREISEEIDWSRSHVQAVLDNYFVQTGTNSATQTIEGGERSLTITIPPDVESERDYLRGYVDGMMR